MSIAEHGHRQDASKLIGTRQVLKLVLRVIADVGDVDDTSSQNGAMGAASPALARRVCIAVGGGAFCRDLLKSNEVDEFAVEPEYGAQPGIAEAQRTCRDAVEYRLYVCRRAADHSQDIAGRGLLLQRLAHLSMGFRERLVLLLQFSEQPHVLNGNDRLIGEGLEQGDLLVGEWTEPQPRDPDRANGATLMQERDGYL